MATRTQQLSLMWGIDQIGPWCSLLQLVCVRGCEKFILDFKLLFLARMGPAHTSFAEHLQPSAHLSTSAEAPYYVYVGMLFFTK